MTTKVTSSSQGVTKYEYLDEDALLTFRTLICEPVLRGAPCPDADRCRHSHCIAWQRRNPAVHPYKPEQCANIQFVKKGDKMVLHNSCQNKRRCKYAHSKEEQLYHPAAYKMKICQAYPKCMRTFCPFAHSEEELRCDKENLKERIAQCLPAPHNNSHGSSGNANNGQSSSAQDSTASTSIAPPTMLTATYAPKPTAIASNPHNRPGSTNHHGRNSNGNANQNSTTTQQQQQQQASQEAADGKGSKGTDPSQGSPAMSQVGAVQSNAGPMLPSPSNAAHGSSPHAPFPGASASPGGLSSFDPHAMPFGFPSFPGAGYGLAGNPYFPNFMPPTPHGGGMLGQDFTGQQNQQPHYPGGAAAAMFSPWAPRQQPGAPPGVGGLFPAYPDMSSFVVGGKMTATNASNNGKTADGSLQQTPMGSPAGQRPPTATPDFGSGGVLGAKAVSNGQMPPALPSLAGSLSWEAPNASAPEQAHGSLASDADGSSAKAGEGHSTTVPNELLASMARHLKLSTGEVPKELESFMTANGLSADTSTTGNNGQDASGKQHSMAAVQSGSHFSLSGLQLGGQQGQAHPSIGSQGLPALNHSSLMLDGPNGYPAMTPSGSLQLPAGSPLRLTSNPSGALKSLSHDMLGNDQQQALQQQQQGGAHYSLQSHHHLPLITPPVGTLGANSTNGAHLSLNLPWDQTASHASLGAGGGPMGVLPSPTAALSHHHQHHMQQLHGQMPTTPMNGYGGGMDSLAMHLGSLNAMLGGGHFSAKTHPSLGGQQQQQSQSTGGFAAALSGNGMGGLLHNGGMHEDLSPTAANNNNGYGQYGGMHSLYGAKDPFRVSSLSGLPQTPQAATSGHQQHSHSHQQALHASFSNPHQPQLSLGGNNNHNSLSNMMGGNNNNNNANNASLNDHSSSCVTQINGGHASLPGLQQPQTIPQHASMGAVPGAMPGDDLLGDSAAAQSFSAVHSVLE